MKPTFGGTGVISVLFHRQSKRQVFAKRGSSLRLPPTRGDAGSGYDDLLQLSAIGPVHHAARLRHFHPCAAISAESASCSFGGAAGRASNRSNRTGGFVDMLDQASVCVK